ncbi:structure-specific recognition protein 1 [Fistulifera solaris]|uniref:Structure-specific recognition protein 1 n=1 Tax=Fistulifera solaris TaxID=1519565 RepID=A0A1Z5JM14_FISSO|nr:structure-specific recognition protein 1 [Fistulifera solaris]|eukprot:GAX14828.1 structure-specific recognition protein 1 [Fistulifera solaris]
MTDQTVVWKHIGLHGHSMGTLSLTKERITWKGALTGGGTADDDFQGTMVRNIPALSIKGAQWTVFGRSGHLRIQIQDDKLPHELRFDGFPAQDIDILKDALQQQYNIAMQLHPMSSAGTQYGLTSVKGKQLVFRHCVLDEINEEGQEFEPRPEHEMMSLNLAEVSQCVLPGNNRNEIEVQFPESDAVEAGTDQLVSIRFYIPPDLDADPSDKTAPTAAELLQAKIMATAQVRKTTGDVICTFDAAKGTFLTPRGRYGMELYDRFLRLRGQKYDYKIKYDDINRLFLLPKPDEVHMAFVIALDKPIRQGQQRYQYLVLQAPKDPDEVTIALDEETLEKEYKGELQPVMRGSLSNLIAKTFKVISGKKVFIPGKFANSNEQACVKCAVRANEGLLYPLEKQFVFIHKPPIIIRFNEIESVEFQRYAGGQGSTRNFDLCVNLKDPEQSTKEYIFSGIDRSDYAGLYNFLNGKQIPIKNLQGSGFMEEDEVKTNRKPVYNEDEIFGPGGGGAEEEGSDDEDYDEDAAAEDEAPGSSDDDDDSDELDDDEMGSEVDEELDSDLEEHRKAGAKTKKAAKRSRDSDDDEEVEEKPKKGKKVKKDPNQPKRALSAYLFYMTKNRDKLKAEKPDLSFGELGKELGARWNEMSAADKAPYEEMASKDKTRYASEMKEYKPTRDAATKKKKKKDPNAPKRSKTSYIFFADEMRVKLKKEHPSMTFGETGKKIGEMFRALSADEKKKYEEMAQKDKERARKEMASYKSVLEQQNGSDNENDDDDDDDDSSDDSDGVNDAGGDHDSDDDSDDSD